MENKIFVGGLAWATTSDSLGRAFEPYGSVTNAVVIVDRETGRSRGFGFVTFETRESMDIAIKEVDGKEVDGRVVRVNEANQREKPQRY